MSVSTFVKHGEREVSIGDPSATALYLSQSFRNFEDALQIHPFVGDWPPPDRKPSEVTYDYLEFIMASIIFAYTSIESFANEEIPEDFNYETQTENGIYIPRQKDWIERNVSLDEKLTIILPEVKEKSSPKGLDVWEGYVQLRRLRHRIIHLKSRDRVSSHDDNLYPESIWSTLLKPKQPNFPLNAKNLILHYKDIENTHWLKYCPY